MLFFWQKNILEFLKVTCFLQILSNYSCLNWCILWVEQLLHLVIYKSRIHYQTHDQLWLLWPLVPKQWLDEVNAWVFDKHYEHKSSQRNHTKVRIRILFLHCKLDQDLLQVQYHKAILWCILNTVFENHQKSLNFLQEKF